VVAETTARITLTASRWLHLAAEAFCDSMLRASIDRYSTMDGIRRCQSCVV